jgi:hypothetical protein
LGNLSGKKRLAKAIASAKIARLRLKCERASHFSDAISRFRWGFSTASAMTAAMRSSAAAIMKTVRQLPMPAGSKFARGITNAAMPFAV